MSERKVIIVTGADTGSLSLQRAIVELVKASFTVIEAEHPPAPPALDFHRHLASPKPLPVNDVRYLRRDERAKEIRTRKTLPKGKGRR